MENRKSKFNAIADNIRSLSNLIEQLKSENNRLRTELAEANNLVSVYRVQAKLDKDSK